MTKFSDAVLCQCGCGLPAPLAPCTVRRRGYLKGQPLRFRKDHYRPAPRTRGGYPAKYRPGHPRASKINGNVKTHIVIAETAYGRSLPHGAEVHHVDGQRTNNAKTNLVICQDATYHRLLHVRTRIVRAGGNPNTEKYCGHCRTVKPRHEFYVNPKNKSTGLRSYCRTCTKCLAHAKSISSTRLTLTHQGE